MTRTPGGTPPSDELLDEASRALFELGRTLARLPGRDWQRPDGGQDAQLGMIVLTQTVDALARRGDTATVGTIATRLRLDPSTASRLVTRGVQAGYVRRVAVQDDGRAVGLELTASGRDLVVAAAGYQRAVFDAVTDDWTGDERATFAHLFIKFAAAVGAASDRLGPQAADEGGKS